MSYWVYENWVAESKAVVHSGDCRFCNDGAGTGRNTRGTRNGKWHGPFASTHEAEAAALATGRPIRRDRCLGVTTSLGLGPAGTSAVAPLRDSQTKSSLPSGEASELKQFGFALAGAWHLDQSAKGGVRFSLNAHREDRAVYAFVVDGRAEYIGICDSSATTLRDRMSRYQNMVGAGTNARIIELIKASIAKGAVNADRKSDSSAD